MTTARPPSSACSPSRWTAAPGAPPPPPPSLLRPPATACPAPSPRPTAPARRPRRWVAAAAGLPSPLPLYAPHLWVDTPPMEHKGNIRRPRSNERARQSSSRPLRPSRRSPTPDRKRYTLIPTDEEAAAAAAASASALAAAAAAAALARPPWDSTAVAPGPPADPGPSVCSCTRDTSPAISYPSDQPRPPWQPPRSPNLEVSAGHLTPSGGTAHRPSGSCGKPQYLLVQSPKPGTRRQRPFAPPATPSVLTQR